MDAVLPFGRWPSPLDAAEAAAGKVSLSEINSDGTSVYWLESRPRDAGRVVLVRAGDDGVVDVSPPAVSIRSRVYDYGGGAFCLVPSQQPGAFAYVDASDQRVWFVPSDGDTPCALTPEPPDGERWAHGGLGASADGTWVVAVREVHGTGGAPSPRRYVVALGTGPDNGGGSILEEGHDFYGAPRLDAATQRLAVVAWDHPDMPWDRSAVIVIPLACTGSASASTRRLVAAGRPWTVECGADVSVGQPQWQRDGRLRFVSDRQGWWQPYTHSGRPGGPAAVARTAMTAEFHGPDWALGQSTMAELCDGSLVARRTAQGRDSVVLLVDDPAQLPQVVDQPCLSIASMCAHKEGVAFIGAPPDGPATVWTLGPLGGLGPLGSHATPAARTPLPVEAIRPYPAPVLGRGDVSVGEAFSFAGRSGRRIHGLFYAPTRKETAGPTGTRPPLLVHCHAGPTGSVGAGYDVVVQYFTSRGFAVAAVDYAGSTGYGRSYRCSLWGQWGVADSDDCVDAARHLAAVGRVDPSRMATRGSSSGGLTALNALADGDCFAAATAWYGVTDLLGLASSTHDFEAHYMDRLVGPLPECRATYEARSPIGRAPDLRGAVLLFQGLEDPMVPPAQTEGLRAALLSHGLDCEVRFFEGEGHGFRRAETIAACLEDELAFYLRAFGVE